MAPPLSVVTEQRLTAFNYATDSENRIHADDVAQKFGFRGGLVPGVGDYAYLARTAQQALGAHWLERGWMEAKFIKPVYGGTQVITRALGTESPQGVTLELLDAEGHLCAVGRAGTPETETAEEWFDPVELTTKDLPSLEERTPARQANLTIAQPLGTLHLTPTETDQWHQASFDRFVDQDADSGNLLLHPAFTPEMGNDILMRNTKLGPWIHTASRVRHLAPLTRHDAVSVRGRVAGCYAKKGREIVELEVGIFVSDACHAQLRHTAIIHLPE